MLNAILKALGIRRERSVDEIVSTFTKTAADLDAKIVENNERDAELRSARSDIEAEQAAVRMETRRAMNFRDNLNALIKE